MSGQYQCLNCGKRLNARVMYCTNECQVQAFASGQGQVAQRKKYQEIKSGEYYRDGAPSQNDLHPDLGRSLRDSEVSHYQSCGGKCVICGEPFEDWHRKNKQTCSDACRRRLSRYRTRVDDNIYAVSDLLNFYADCIDIPELKDKATATLSVFREMIDEILEEQS